MSMTEEECKEETQKHARRVWTLIRELTFHLENRGAEHDESKMEPPELAIFTKFTPKLNEVPYDSDEYKGYLSEMQPALDHHYEVNRHHPQHFGGDISKMNLVDLVEMLCDWVAAAERHGIQCSPLDSINANQKKFGISDQLAAIFSNTVLLLQEK
jgi:hypothetical protein